MRSLLILTLLAAGTPPAVALRTRRLLRGPAYEGHAISSASSARRLDEEFPVCGVRVHISRPSESAVCETDQDKTTYGVACCKKPGSRDDCSRKASTNIEEFGLKKKDCYAGEYDDDDKNESPDKPRTWKQAMEVCQKDGKVLCDKPVYHNDCGGGCGYSKNGFGVWSNEPCQPWDTGYDESCTAPPPEPTARPTPWSQSRKLWMLFWSPRMMQEQMPRLPPP